MTRLAFLTGTLLLLAGCGNGSVGRPCTVPTDCDSGQFCLTAAPGGYCTRSCSEEGKAPDCPGDTVCAKHDALLYCSQVCETQSDCRDDYECNGVTGASKACRPKKS